MHMEALCPIISGNEGTTSKVNYILFNKLLSPVLLNKSDLERAKAVNFNSNFLNKCFSN